VRPVNLLPQEQRRQASGQRPGSAYAVVGVLALLLAMAVGYVLTTNQANSRTADADAARAEADNLEAQAQRLGSFTNFATIRETRLASVASVAQSRFDWERMMRELAKIMPEGSWVQTTDASVTGVSADGSEPSTDASTGAAPSGPSATFVGCTPKQSDVALMMVRMRRMHRVEDVVLNESAQETNGEAATVENCGDLYKYDVTVRFSAALPTGEAPRGTRSVPASLGGGS
jgi:Tfp pilus assembly protein PilN